MFRVLVKMFRLYFTDIGDHSELYGSSVQTPNFPETFGLLEYFFIGLTAATGLAPM